MPYGRRRKQHPIPGSTPLLHSFRFFRYLQQQRCPIVRRTMSTSTPVTTLKPIPDRRARRMMNAFRCHREEVLLLVPTHASPRHHTPHGPSLIPTPLIEPSSALTRPRVGLRIRMDLPAPLVDIIRTLAGTSSTSRRAGKGSTLAMPRRPHSSMPKVCPIHVLAFRRAADVVTSKNSCGLGDAPETKVSF